MHHSWYPVPQRRFHHSSLLISIAGQNVEITWRIRMIWRFTFNHCNAAWKRGKNICEISTNYLDITDCRVCDFHFFFSPLTSQKSKRAPRVVHLDVDLMKKSTALENIVTKQQTTAWKLVPVTQCRYSQLLLRSSRKVSIYSLQVSITKECPTLPLWRLLPCNPCSWKASTLPCKQTEKQQQQVVRD